MSADLLQALIPIVSVLAVFGMPVALVFVHKYFKIKERELAVESETRTWTEKKHLALEQRVKRLEDVLLSLDQDVRTRLGLGQPTSLPDDRRALMEGPTGTDPAAAARDPDRNKVR